MDSCDYEASRRHRSVSYNAIFPLTQAAIEYQQVFTDGYTLRDRLVKIGSGTKKDSHCYSSLD